jgi:transcriptional regulator with XRE-family HTH domain
MTSRPLAYEFQDCLGAIGAAIRAMRRELELSQEELAHMASIDRSHMGKIERGERNLSVVNMLRISAALRCKPSELLMRAGF